MNARTVSQLALLVGVTGCGDPPRQEAPAFNPGPAPSELALGEQEFNRTCAACHGSLAMGTDAGPPLVHIIYEPGHHADESFRRAVTLGVVPHHWNFGPMPPQPSVTPAQVDAIVRYVRWLQGKAGIT